MVEDVRDELEQKKHIFSYCRLQWRTADYNQWIIDHCENIRNDINKKTRMLFDFDLGPLDIESGEYKRRAYLFLVSYHNKVYAWFDKFYNKNRSVGDDLEIIGGLMELGYFDGIPPILSTDYGTSEFKLDHPDVFPEIDEVYQRVIKNKLQ